MTVNRDGIHGVAVCERPATARYVMVCPLGHTSDEPQPLCDWHARQIALTKSGVCPRCIHVPEERAIQEEMNHLMREISQAMFTGDRVTQGRKSARLDDLRRAMDELNARGISVKRPLRLVEVS